jgi:hypothetical protein
MLSTDLRLGLPSGRFPSGFPTNNLFTFLFQQLGLRIQIYIYTYIYHKYIDNIYCGVFRSSQT